MTYILFYWTIRLFLILFVVFPLSAKSDLDSTLTAVCADIGAKCRNNQIVAVLGFSSAKREMSAYIVDSLVSNLTQAGNVRVVTRANLDKIEKELNFQMSGFVSDETALSICGKLGAQAIVFGSLDELDNRYRLQVKVLDVESAAYMLFKSYIVYRSSVTEQLLGRAAIYYKSALGFMAEANKNCVESIAPAGGISFDYSFVRRFSFGLKAVVSYDLYGKRVDENEVVTFEPLATLRAYVASPSGEPGAGLFLEGQGGATILFVNDEVRSVGNAGVSLGYRTAIGNAYIEPYLRGGYPYLFGAGLSLGVRF